LVSGPELHVMPARHPGWQWSAVVWMVGLSSSSRLLILIGMGPHLLGEARKPVTNQVTTLPDSRSQHRTQPDTACDLTCRHHTARDPGRRNRSAWHASPGIPSGSPRRRENPGPFPLSAGGLAVAG